MLFIRPLMDVLDTEYVVVSIVSTTSGKSSW